MMNKIMQKLTGRQIILFVSGLVSLLIGIFLMVAGSLKIQTLQEQHMAARWSDENDVSQIKQALLFPFPNGLRKWRTKSIDRHDFWLGIA